MQIVRWLYLSGLVFAMLIPAGWQMSPEGLDDASRWQPSESQSARSFASNLKRHSEGTFTSDFTRYLDKMKAKDFVHWLINTKRYSSTKRYLKEEPRGIPFPAAFPPLALPLSVNVVRSFAFTGDVLVLRSRGSKAPNRSDMLYAAPPRRASLSYR
ncbi:PREDICTED: glucagon-2-like [Nipponia nippon]|uniref:glucagon-2-like n=1 Tax=Nipponia nippon TaxID=128390 RepID=UPI000510F4BA|nr:PREDICTED: glucagon-2-like [Nipponia nippon]